MEFMHSCIGFNPKPMQVSYKSVIKTGETVIKTPNTFLLEKSDRVNMFKQGD